MNKVAFYYRKDLNVTKHGEYKAHANMLMGDAVKRNETTGKVELAANSADFEGVVDKIIFNTQGNDSLEIKADERVRIGVGKDFEIVVKGNHPALNGMTVGADVGVLNGKFVALNGTTVTVAVGKLVQKFASGENVLRLK